MFLRDVFAPSHSAALEHNLPAEEDESPLREEVFLVPGRVVSLLWKMS